MPARRPAPSTGRPLGSRAGETRGKVLALLLEEHARSGLWLGRDTLGQRLGISPQAASGHRRQLIREGRLDAEAASPDRALRTERLPFRLVLVDEQILSGEQAAPGQLDLVDFLTRAADACFAVQVTDRMEVPALGILAGSYVIVDPALRRTRGRLHPRTHAGEEARHCEGRDSSGTGGPQVGVRGRPRGRRRAFARLLP